MAFQPYVEIAHHEWTIQQTWNEKDTQFDRVAVKGTRRIEQGGMTYSAFLRLLDGIDGRKAGASAAIPASAVPAPPAAAPAPKPEPGPAHPSLFGDVL